MPLDRLAALRGLQPDRVCLIKPSSLGDIVHALPVLAAFRDLWPNARISWVVNRGLRGLLDGHPDLDEVIPFDRARVGASPRGIATMTRFLVDLRRRNFDLTVDLQGLLRSGIMTLATGAPIRVGLADAREGAGHFYHHRIASTGAETHAVDRMLRVAQAFGADISGPRFRVAYAPEDAAWARGVLAPIGRPILAVNVGARWLTKRWPPEHFAAVARRAVETRGAGLVLVGAPEDRSLVDNLKGGLGGIPTLDLCGRTTLPQLAALSAQVDVFLSNDTGPLHLAAAAGARTVGVYTCTSPIRTGPYGPEALAVRSCVWCAPSYLKNCDRLECMAELTPARVWAAVESQIEASAQGRRVAG